MCRCLNIVFVVLVVGLFGLGSFRSTGLWAAGMSPAEASTALENSPSVNGTCSNACEQPPCDDDCDCESDPGTPPPVAPGPSINPEGYTSYSGSIIDNLTLNHIHIAKDYVSAKASVVGSSGCGGCGSSSASDPTRLRYLQIERRHRLRNQSILGSFGPGVFMNQDIRLDVYAYSTGWQMDFFSPSDKVTRRYVDGQAGDAADGVFHDVQSKSIKDAQLLDGPIDADGKATGDLVTELHRAKSILVTQKTGSQSHYEVSNLSPAKPMKTTGHLGDALLFDGDDDFVGFDNPASLNLSGQTTLATWVKPDSTSKTHHILTHGQPGNASSTGVFLRINWGWYEVGSWDGTQKHQARFPIPSGDLGSWVHLAGAYDGTHWRLYRNGVEVASTATTVGSVTSAEPWRFGTNRWASWGFYEGVMDDVRIYNQGLSASDVASLHSGGTVTTGLVGHWTLDADSAEDAVGDNHGSLGPVNGERAARITRINDVRDYAMRYQYKTFTPEEIAEAPDRLRQFDTITDANGRTATFQYNPQQQSGGWVVSQITLPNGGVLQYSYVDGRLSQVDHPDGTQSTITIGSDAPTQTTTITYDDPGATGTHRKKTVYLTNNIVGGDYRVYNNSALLLRMLINGDGEVGYLSLPDPDPLHSNSRAIYEGGGKLRLITGGREARYYEEDWDVVASGGTIQITGTRESRFPRFTGTDPHHAFYTGEFETVRDNQGRVSLYEFDAESNPTKKTYEDGTSESWTYNSFRSVLRHRDRLNRVTKNQFDALGELTQKSVGILADSTDPDNESLDANQPEYAQYVTTYYPAGHVNQHLKQYEDDANGNRTQFVYNADHQLMQIHEPDDTGNGFHVASSFTYDGAKRLKTASDALGRTKTFTYDNRDRLVQVAYDDSSNEQRVYGSAGSGDENLLVFTKDRNGVVSENQYDSTGRAITRATAIDNVGPSGSILSGYSAPANYPADARVTTTTYLEGVHSVESRSVNGRTTSYEYDYRLRAIKTTVKPRAGQSLVRTKTYVNNLLFYSTDPYGRKEYYAYRPSDNAMIRKVMGTVPSFSIDIPWNVLTKARNETYNNPALNADYLVYDVILDAEGQNVANIDPRGIVGAYGYDSRGRRTLSVEAATTLPPYNQATFDVTDDSQLDALAGKTETLYDANSNVLETRTPRYFDVADTDGFQLATNKRTYNRRNLSDTATEASASADYVAGDPSAIRVTRTSTYNLDKTLATQTDFRGNVTETLWSPCCAGRVTSTLDALATATSREYDKHGNVTATQRVHGAGTYAQTTRRYDNRHRPIATTTWLVEQSGINPDAAPIAGGGLPGDPALLASGEPVGLTTRMIYDEDLSDGVALDASGGLTVNHLDGNGTFNVSLAGMLAKLSTAGITSDAGSSFSARVTINPEEEISVAISDGSGRGIVLGSIEQDAAGTPITWSITQHDSLGNAAGFGDCVVTKSINADGDITQRFTDSAGRTIQSIDAAGKISTKKHDGNGNTLVSRDASDVGKDCLYDVRGRDTQCTDTAGAVTSRVYDKSSNVVSKTDAKGNVDTCAFDARNRQYACTDRIGGVTSNRYDQDSRLLTLTDAEGQVTAYAYDAVGNKLSETMPDHVAGSNVGNAGYGVVSFGYDELHRVAVRTDQQGDTCTHAYDLASRLLSKVYAGHASGSLAGTNDTDSFTYDNAGRMLTATSGRYGNSCLMAYDEAGRKETESLTIGGQTYTTTTAYDDVGRVATLTYPNGDVISRGYTNRSQLETIDVDSTTIDTRTYDDSGRMLTSAYNNGVSETRSYNDDNTLASIAFTGAPVGNLTYGWDDNKNKTSEGISGTLSGFGFDVGTTGYDDEDRLVNWQRTDNNLDQSWNLSLVGDWNSHTENASVQARTHGPTHEMLTVAGQALQHDAQGNQTMVPAVLRPGSDPLAMKWDFENKLMGADTDADGIHDVTYQFDAMGRRVARDDGTTSTVFVQSGQQTISDYTLGTAAASPIYTYVFASYIDEPVMRGGTGGLRYYHRGQQFSINAMTNGGGSVVERYAYTAYGTPTITDSAGVVQAVSSEGNRYLYTGREWDEELSLYHYRARMYDSRSGRFVSRDPIGYLDGHSLYRAYFGLDELDPSGLSKEKDSLANCFADCSKKWPEPEKRDGETDEDFEDRETVQTNERNKCRLQCMKKKPPTGCDPYEPPKNGPEKDKKGCWIDKKGRKWCPDMPGDEDPHYDITPPMNNVDDVWETPCCNCHTKKDKKTGNIYTRCFPK